jgi:hypothetical protein
VLHWDNSSTVKHLDSKKLADLDFRKNINQVGSFFSVKNWDTIYHFPDISYQNCGRVPPPPPPPPTLIDVL